MVVLKKKIAILLSSFGRTSLVFLFMLVFALNFNKHACNEGEEKETYFALKIIYAFVHICEAYCRYSNIDFARNMKEVCNSEYGL